LLPLRHLPTERNERRKPLRPLSVNPVRHPFPSEPPFDSITAAFTTRHLGKSKPPFASLNTGLHTDDDPINVIKNRKLVFETLSLDPDSLTTAQQVHGEHVQKITEKERGRGAEKYADAIPETDALITDVPNTPIGVFTADCVPIFLYDPERIAIGIVHAGWRSTVRGIARKTVARMSDEYGSNPAHMWAAFGPSIGPCCYEVGQDVFDAFNQGTEPISSSMGRPEGGTIWAQSPKGSVPNAKWYLDLWFANSLQLQACGLNTDQVINPRICSACNADDYFSARKHGARTGRTLSVIAIKPA
jgi:YfiH family protein